MAGSAKGIRAGKAFVEFHGDVSTEAMADLNSAAAIISGSGDPQLRELQSINRGINTLVNQQLKFT
jgi:hypothetical protein